MSYPKIKDNDFYDKIEKKYAKYKISGRKKSLKQICYPNNYKLQMPQQFLAKYISKNTPYKGILIFHKIGAGKTCTAVRIGEEWKKDRKIIVLTPASLVNNFKDELRSKCAGNSYISDKQRLTLDKLHPSSDEYKKIIEKSDNKIDKYYNIMSYNKFINDYEENKINLNNSILIIDEIQNMISEQGIYYKTIYNAIKKGPSNLRIVLLSATPIFDKPLEIALTMNLLKLPKEFPNNSKDFSNMFLKCNKGVYEAKNLDLFKNMIKGYISYYRGAPPYVFPEEVIKFVKCEMENFQYKSYVTVLNNETNKSGIMKIKDSVFKEGQIRNMPNNFFIGTRLISNIAFPNKGIGEIGYNSLTDNKMKLDNLKKYSIKFYKIMVKLKYARGPILIYSNFKEYGGIKTLVKILEYHGYKNYDKNGEGRKRFAIWSGDESKEYKNEIKTVYNRENNHNGSKIKIILLTPSAKEGVSFKRVQQMHILEPYWNWSRMMQIIGRAVRYCSHKDLDEDKRLVRIYIYISTKKNIKTIDKYIKNMAETKKALINEFTNAMKESAIDCRLFSKANKLDDPYVCE